MTQSHTTFYLRYSQPSLVENTFDATLIRLAQDRERPPTGFRGTLSQSLLFREALSSFYQVYASDLRFKGRDRSAYLQYLQKQAAKDPSAAKTAAQMKQAEAFLLAQLQQEEETTQDILDPLLTIHPDKLLLETFSKDESSYAALSISWDLFSSTSDVAYGTTNVEFSPDFFDALQRMRSYKETQIEMGQQGISLSVEESGPPAKALNIPDSWLRGFVQVQAAATLPMTTFTLAPIDLYNVLSYLRRNRSKKGPRGLRYELIPGEHPRLILEPTEKLLYSQGDVYAGPRPQIVRTWGRQRLFLLRQLLPFLQTIKVHTLGSGLPTFYELVMPNMTLTLGLSGWTQQNWSASVQFDTMLPQVSVAESTFQTLRSALAKQHTMSLDDLLTATTLKRTEMLVALQSLCQQGVVTYDLPQRQFRYREIATTPLQTERLRYRNEREQKAYSLLQAHEQSPQPLIQITKINHVLGSGTEIHGEIEDRAAYRSYQVSFLLDLDGRLTQTKCTSPWYQRTQGKEGPSEFILALLLLYRRQETALEAMRLAGQDRQIIVAETRTLTRRKHAKETVYQLTLDHKQLRIQWGTRDQEPRKQTFLFNQEDEARHAYFARLDQLASQGYVDTHA